MAILFPAEGAPTGRSQAVVATWDPLEGLLTSLAESVDGSRVLDVRHLQDRWSHARLRMLLVGEAKRGKSTVGNAILRRELLPTGVVPLTSVATTIRAGRPERIEVHDRMGGMTTATLTDLARYVTEAGNPGNRLGVDHVIVFVESVLPHPRLELVDTPGVGSVHQHNTLAAETAMQEMDIAVLVLTVDPPISAAEHDLLAKIRRLSARVYVVLNKIDQLEQVDRTEAEQFTRHVVADALSADPADVQLFPVSARAAARASVSDEPAAWQASGMAAFARVLEHHLRDSWADDLGVSIAGSARRLCAELIDENALARRARDLQSAEQSRAVATFRQHLNGLDARRDDAAAAGGAQLRRCQSALDADAVAVIGPITAAIQRDLDARLTRSPHRSAADLETAGWSALTDLVAAAVEAWRASWSDRLARVVDEAAARQQQLLNGAFDDIRLAAAELLGVELTAPAPQLALPDERTFRFDLTPEVGWNQPVTSAVRRRIPGSVGRARMRRFLRDEAARLVDKHIGRARSDFQARLSQLARDLRTAADQAYTRRQTQLREVLDAATRNLAVQSATDPVGDRLTDLADRFDHLIKP